MSLISLLENMGGRTPACAEFYHWFDRSKESKYVRVHLSQETAPGSPLWLAAIQSHKKNAGYTRTVMQHVLRVADKHQLPIMLVVDDESESWHWLESWYERLGFKKTGNQREYGPEMRREPHGSLTEAANNQINEEFTALARQNPNITRIWGRKVVCLDFHGEPTGPVNEPGQKDIYEGAQFKTDNPGGDWLRNKQEAAEEKWSRLHGITGATTGYFTEPVQLPVETLITLPGARGEEAFRHGGPKQDQLASQVGTPDKFDSREYPILVGVNHRGGAFIVEGNHRLAYAHKNGIKTIWADVRYFNGGEAVPGPMEPAIVLKMQTLQESVSGPGFDPTSLAKDDKFIAGVLRDVGMDSDNEIVYEWRREPQGSLTEATQYFTGFNHQPPRHLTQKYMRGECVYLALAFHAVKRYEIVELGPEHVATRDPEGFFWDIRGKMTETQAMDGVSPGEIKVVTKDEAIGLLGAFSDGPFVGSRLRAAKDVVRALS